MSACGQSQPCVCVSVHEKLHTHAWHRVYRVVWLCAGLCLQECDPWFIKEVFWPGQSAVQDDDKGVFLPNSLNRSVLQCWQKSLTNRQWRTFFSIKKLDKLNMSVDSYWLMVGLNSVTIWWTHLQRGQIVSAQTDVLIKQTAVLFHVSHWENHENITKHRQSAATNRTAFF